MNSFGVIYLLFATFRSESGVIRKDGPSFNFALGTVGPAFEVV